MKYQKDILANGLRVLSIPMPSLESVTVLIQVRVGSRYEEKNINGISHFLEHMAFKGTEKRPSAQHIASTIDGIGGEFNAFTSKDHTGYYIKAAAKNLPLLMDVLSDMLLYSKFDPVEIEKEKGVIIEEINMYDDTPMHKVPDLYENLLYGDTKLGRDIAGQKDVIRSVKREDFIAYMDRFYGPKNTVVAVSGGIGESVKELAKKYLGGWKEKKVEEPDRVKDEQRKPGVLVHFKDTQQAHMCIGVRSYPLGHPDRYKLGVMTAILGGGMSSRLFMEVREKRGLAYYVRSQNEQYHDVGNFVTQAGIDTVRIDDAVKVTLGEFVKMKEKEVGDEELKKAKEYLKGRLTLELEDSRSVAGMLGTAQLLGEKNRLPKEIKSKIEEGNATDIKKVAGDIFKSETLNLAIIGPYKNKERFKKILSL